MTIAEWSSTPANNASGITGVTLAEGQVPSSLNDAIRQLVADVAVWRDGMAYGMLTVTGVAGTANAITGNTSPAPTLAANQKFLLVPTATNTAATTLALNSGAAKNIYAGNSALVGGELHANIPVLLEYDGTQLQLVGPVFRQQTRQTLLSGSGATYTTPVGATRISIRLVGAGGGGAGSGSGGGAGGTGGNTTFSTLTGSGGVGGTQASGAAGGAGGAASGGDINIPGSYGGAYCAVNSLPGSQGGAGPWGGQGGGGSVNNNGISGAANSGSGGGGGGGTTGTPSVNGSGGGSGGYVEKLLVAPAATYTYTVGAAGTAGSAGGSGQTGGAGGTGIIIVDEYYN